MYDFIKSAANYINDVERIAKCKYNKKFAPREYIYLQ